MDEMDEGHELAEMGEGDEPYLGCRRRSTYHAPAAGAYRPEVMPARPPGRLQVTLAHDGQVVRAMPRHDVGQRADGDRVAAGDAAARPGVARQVAHERQGRLPDGPELLAVPPPGPFLPPSPPP